MEKKFPISLLGFGAAFLAIPFLALALLAVIPVPQPTANQLERFDEELSVMILQKLENESLTDHDLRIANLLFNGGEPWKK